ncbi:surface protein P113, putative (P113) [Plasmodium ovale wallikeri]|uniref:Surface protein P113, putative n=2 Tax=Plasmodium ovale TaxID=36330 RepID=A0A1C3KXB5_PLAOA|nr:surface protein P113, putative (P113) [Plasmodium ovale wallikeri]SBT57830.1 surface protein P113, putative (P113) [Plasmodium ovale wallikeri]SBT78862.1 surface protein P113, putative [Plasmodium ovale]
MKRSLFCFFLFILHCYFASLGGCYVHNDIIKFGEENSLQCSQGSLYILHCEVQCLNGQNRIIHKRCIDEVEEKCKGNSKCHYYFDYVFRAKNQSFRNKNSIEIDECVESEQNEIKTSTTCILSNSFLLDETSIQYFFFVKNKNEEPITCKSGNINIKSAILHSPFCDVKLKDITEYAREHCDNNKECVINPYEIQKNTLNEKNDCYINNSYVSLNVVCTDGSERDGEEQNVGGSEHIDSFDEQQEFENSYGGEEKTGENKSEEGEEVCKDGNDDVINKIMSSNESNEEKIKKAKSVLLERMDEELSKRDDIFTKLAQNIARMANNKYKVEDIKDMLEDRYNELKRSTNYELYYIYLVDTLQGKKKPLSELKPSEQEPKPAEFDFVGETKESEDDIVNLSAFEDELQSILQDSMNSLDIVEKAINKLRKTYHSVYKKAKNNDLGNLYDENEDIILTYDDFPIDNKMIGADIFFKYHPQIKKVNFKDQGSYNKDTNDEKIYKDIMELDMLDEFNKKKRIINIRNILVDKLKILYTQQNNIFSKQASCIKSYCFKKPLNVTNFSVFLKHVYHKLKEYYEDGTSIHTFDPVHNVIKYLKKVAEMNNKNWINTDRITKKVNVVVNAGFTDVYEIEKEIHEKTSKYNALFEKAKILNLERLFNESDNILKKASMIASAHENADEVFGTQMSFFDIFKKSDTQEKSPNHIDKDSEKSKEEKNVTHLGKEKLTEGNIMHKKEDEAENDEKGNTDEVGENEAKSDMETITNADHVIAKGHKEEENTDEGYESGEEKKKKKKKKNFDERDISKEIDTEKRNEDPLNEQEHGVFDKPKGEGKDNAVDVDVGEPNDDNIAFDEVDTENGAVANASGGAEEGEGEGEGKSEKEKSAVEDEEEEKSAAEEEEEEKTAVEDEEEEKSAAEEEEEEKSAVEEEEEEKSAVEEGEEEKSAVEEGEQAEENVKKTDDEEESGKESTTDETYADGNEKGHHQEEEKIEESSDTPIKGEDDESIDDTVKEIRGNDDSDGDSDDGSRGNDGKGGDTEQTISGQDVGNQDNGNSSAITLSKTLLTLLAAMSIGFLL